MPTHQDAPHHDGHPSRALVLGGGGTLGIAWETGLLAGLHKSGLDLGTADLLIGTSAGSVVATLTALGQPFAAQFGAQLGPPDQAADAPIVFDPVAAMAIGVKWAAPELTPAVIAEIGALALAAQTGSEDVYLQRFAAVLEGLPWPARALYLTAVDAADGRRIAWDQASGAALVRAVASSCAIPGVFPPVTINGRRYMDGGVGSTTNADLAHNYKVVVIIAPIPALSDGISVIARQRMNQEIALLEAAGSKVVVLIPDAESLEAFGPNLMDTSRRAAAAQSGLRQGAQVAAPVQAVWHI